MAGWLAGWVVPFPVQSARASFRRLLMPSEWNGMESNGAISHWFRLIAFKHTLASVRFGVDCFCFQLVSKRDKGWSSFLWCWAGPKYVFLIMTCQWLVAPLRTIKSGQSTRLDSALKQPPHWTTCTKKQKKRARRTQTLLWPNVRAQRAPLSWKKEKKWKEKPLVVTKQMALCTSDEAFSRTVPWELN